MELLVVVAIIAVLSAILFPVFSRVRAASQQSVCLSNQRQVGAALLLYAQDYDERFPNGLNQGAAGRIWPAEGWAGPCLPYLQSAALLRCPSDATVADAANPHDFVVSYALNSNVVGTAYRTDPIPTGLSQADLTAPSRSVLLFEVSGVRANIADPREGSGPGGVPGTNFSASGPGLDNRLYAQRDWSTNTANTYATGYLGGRAPFDATATQFPLPTGRHSDGANYVFADGHTAYEHGDRVSSGHSAPAPACAQDNAPPLSGCAGAFTAAGTANADYAATFSAK